MNPTRSLPTYADVLDALPRVRAVLNPTLLHQWPGLSERVGSELYLKHENHQPVGAFKVRGGVNLVATLSPEERAAGIIGVSTGNHGQSLAFAARHFGVRCTIIVPTGNNPDKNRAIRQLGADRLLSKCPTSGGRCASASANSPSPEHRHTPTWNQIACMGRLVMATIHGNQPLSLLVSTQSSFDAFLAVEKHLLIRQGVFRNTLVRGPVGCVLDEESRQEIDRLFESLVEGSEP